MYPVVMPKTDVPSCSSRFPSTLLENKAGLADALPEVGCPCFPDKAGIVDNIVSILGL